MKIRIIIGWSKNGVVGVLIMRMIKNMGMLVLRENSDEVKLWVVWGRWGKLEVISGNNERLIRCEKKRKVGV